MNNIKIIVIAILLVVLMVVSSSFYVVDQRQMALVIQFGDPVALKTTSGLKFKIPFIQKVVFFDNRIQNLIADTKEVIASDQKTMRVDAFTKYRIVDGLKFYQTVRSEVNFKNRLDSIVESSLRQVLGEVPFQALLSPQRRVLMNKIKELVDAQAQSFGVRVVDVRIMRADLPEESRNAVYNRMRTDREKEAREIRAQGTEESKKIKAIARKEETVILAEARRNADIIKGEGDAQATEVFAKAYSKDPEFYEFYRSMEAYKKTIGKDTDTMLLSSDSKFMRYFKDNK